MIIFHKGPSDAPHLPEAGTQAYTQAYRRSKIIRGIDIYWYLDSKDIKKKLWKSDNLLLIIRPLLWKCRHNCSIEL